MTIAIVMVIVTVCIIITIRIETVADVGVRYAYGVQLKTLIGCAII